MANLNTQIGVTADSSKVAAGLEPGKRALKDLGGAASDTGKALGGIGNGTAQSAQKVESATKSMIQSIQRTTAATEAGDKSSRAYQESLARIRGVDVAALKPYLDQLDAVKAKQLTAASAAKSYENSFAGIKTAAVAAGAALAGFGLAVGKLVSVQREFDILNSSLITVTGSSAAAAREMQWIKDFAKETPFGLAQATQGFVKMKALGLDPTRASLTSFGNTASAMGKDLNQMIEAVADASTGEFERLKEFGIKAKKEGDNVSLTFQGIATTIGNSATEITQYLEKLGSVEFAGAMAERAKTLDGAISELGDTWDELFRTINTNNTGSLIYDSITLATAAIGDATTIINAMTGAASANAKETGAMAAIQGGIATVFETVAVVGANLKFVLVGIGNEIDGLAAQVGQAAQFNFAGVRAIREQMMADAKSARAEIDATTARILGARDAAKELASYNTRNASAQADPRRLDTVTAAEAVTKAVKATTAAIKEAAKANADAVKSDIAAFDVMNKLREKADIARREDFEKTMEAYAKASEAGVSNAIAAATAAETELANYGLLKSEVQSLTLVQLEQARESAAMAGEDVANIEKRIAAQKRLIAATKGIEGIKTNEDAAKLATKSAADAAAEWQKTSDSINSTLTDALMRGFESGKDFARNLRDTVVNMFKTMVLRPVISAVMNPIAQGITGAMGLSGAAQAGQAVSTGSSLLSAAGMASSLAGIGSTIAGMAGTAIGAATGGLVAANAATVTLLTGSASSAAAAATAAATAGGAAAGAASTAAAAGSSAAASLASVALPVAAVVAALAAFGAFRTTKQTGTGISGTLGDDASLTGFNEMRKSGYLFGGPKYWDEIKALDPLMAKALKTDFANIKAAATGAADAIGLASTEVAGFSKAFRIEFTGDKAKDEALYTELMAGTADDLAKTILGSYKEAITTVTEEIASGAHWDSGETLTSTVTRQVATSSYTPSEFAREGETASQTLSRLATSITLVNGTSDLLGNALLSVGLSGANTASLLIDAFGGAESYAAQMGSYYTNFYTQAERTAKLTDNTSKAFEALGLAMPKLDESARDVYRSLVDEAAAKDMSVESNRTAYASLIALQGPMNELAPAFDDLSDSMTSAAKAAALAATSQMTWQDKINAITGDPKAIAASREYAKARDLASTTDPLTKALIETAYQYEDEVAARQKQLDLMTMQDEAMQSWITTQQAVTDAQKQYASVLKSTIGTLKDFLSSLNVGSTPGQRLSGARSDFGTLAARASSGDASVYDKLAPAAKSFLDISKNYSKSIQDYKRDEAAVRNSLQSVIAVNQQELDKLPAEISAASNPTREAWLALKEATDKEAMAHILVTAMSVDQIASQARLNGTTKSLETRYLELITTLPNGEALNKTFWDTMDLAIKTFVPATEADFGFADSFAATTGAADALTAALDPMGIDPKKLALSLGISEEAAKVLAIALSASGISPAELATALGLTGSAADALTIALATSGVDPAALAVSLGLTGAAADSLAIALSENAIDPKKLAVALGLTESAAGYLASAMSVDGLDPAELATALGLTATAADTLTSVLSKSGLDPAAVAAALGLTGAAAQKLTTALSATGISPAELAKSLGLTGTAADSLAKALDPTSIKVASLAEALGLPDAAARILGVALTDYAARISAAVVPTISTPTASTAYGAGPISDAYQTLFGRTPDAVGAEFWKASGLAGSALFEGIRAGAQGSDIDAKKLRGYAIGTNYVMQDGPAYLHQGEAVVPKAYNPAVATQARDEAVVAEIRALREEVTLLRSEAKAGQNAIAHNTRKSAEALDKFDIDGLPATRS